MVQKRVLDPLPIWDVPSVTEAFDEAGIPTLHVPKLYKFLMTNPEGDLSEIAGMFAVLLINSHPLSLF